MKGPILSGWQCFHIIYWAHFNRLYSPAYPTCMKTLKPNLKCVCFFINNFICIINTLSPLIWCEKHNQICIASYQCGVASEVREQSKIKQKRPVVLYLFWILQYCVCSHIKHLYITCIEHVAVGYLSQSFEKAISREPISRTQMAKMKTAQFTDP